MNDVKMPIRNCREIFAADDPGLRVGIVTAPHRELIERIRGELRDL